MEQIPTLAIKSDLQAPKAPNARPKPFAERRDFILYTPTYYDKNIIKPAFCDD